MTTHFFYTDCSVQALGTEIALWALYGINLVSTHPSYHSKALVDFFPLQQKQRTIALLVVRIAVKFKISLIQSTALAHFKNKFYDLANLSVRHQMKIKNFLLWKLIF